jgi:predicted DNA-binding transcriptional regulator YafY
VTTNPTDGLLSATETADLHKVSYMQLYRWVSAGYLTVALATRGDHAPAVVEHLPAQTPGSGSTRWFTATEAAAVGVMARLVRAGLSPAVAARVAHGDPDLGPGIRVVIDP